MRTVMTLAVVGAIVLPGCGLSGIDDPVVRAPSDEVDPATGAAVEAEPTADPLPRFAAHEPDAVEEFPNAKRVAGRAAAAMLTYVPGDASGDILGRAGVPAENRGLARRLLDEIRRDGEGSTAEVIYVQMAGTTETTFGGMVVVRQITRSSSGEDTSFLRVVDVRLRRSTGPWTVERVASLGGKPVTRPSDLPPEAQSVLDDPRITLTDSARWDIHRGGVATELLGSLAAAAREHRFSVAVLSSGHPANVWATDRLSAHTSGAAADIYAVDGRLVIRQREADSPAHRLARRFLDQGARQVGSPFDFDGPGRTSFTDEVHQDHIHVQQAEADRSALSDAPG